jgi:mono/diheme cytochrome c family protein
MRTSCSEEGKPRESRSKRFIAWKSRWVWGVLSLGALVGLLTGIAFWWLTRGPGQSDASTADQLVQPLDLKSVEIGRGVYRANCAQCHGLKGEGQPNWRQQNAEGTYPPPPHDSTGHTWHHADGLLYRIVRDGGKIYEDPGFKSAMPAFGERLNPEEIRAVITYLKSLWGPRERAFQAEVSLADPFPQV